MSTDLSKTLGQRISRQRQTLGLTQKDLALQVGFSSAEIISQIELGKREVKAWELAKLAQILYVNLSDLLSLEEPNPFPGILWRVLPSDQIEAKEAKFLKNCQQYSLLEELSGTIIRKSFPQKSLSISAINFITTERLAVDIREEFSLGDKPASVLQKTLEDKYGVKIFYESMDEGSAASTIGSFGPAILMNRNEAPWRRNYNFAHEVFHLITWESIPARSIRNNKQRWDYMEKLANYFASCLLLPEEIVRIEIEEKKIDNEIDYSDLIEIARKFDVSTEALIYRLLNLKLIKKKVVHSILNDPVFRSYDRATMHASWWDPPQLPERYVRLAFVAYQKGKLSRAKLARLLDVNLLDIGLTFRKYGLDDSQLPGKIEIFA
jgi:Zn-dependent peptidase ImmA (M78 family)/DNA-binding XRE family transcriptional regulator